MADYLTDPTGKIWRLTGLWCSCLYPLETPQDIERGHHEGCRKPLIENMGVRNG
jgi:hypothetical protein